MRHLHIAYDADRQWTCSRCGDVAWRETDDGVTIPEWEMALIHAPHCAKNDEIRPQPEG